MIIIKTKRLILRTWKKSDMNHYFNINQDSKVRKFLHGIMTMEDTSNFINNCNDEIENKGYGLFAAEVLKTNELIGFIGLSDVKFNAHFTPAIEIGWRLGSQYWGKGYATEGAKAVLDYGFNKIKLNEVVSFTVSDNKNSINVMEKIGMKRDYHADFTHPKLEPNHILSRHILYRIFPQDFLNE